MKNEFITVDELKSELAEDLRTASPADLKWLYCYFRDFEEFPLVLDEPAPTKQMLPHLELVETFMRLPDQLTKH